MKAIPKFIILCFISGFSILIFLYAASLLSDFHFIVDLWTFIFLIFGVAVIAEVGVLALRFIAQRLMPLKPKSGQLITWTKDAIKKAKLNSGTTYIFIFMCLLVICAFLLIFEAEKAAEQFANVTYFLLAIGV